MKKHTKEERSRERKAAIARYKEAEKSEAKKTIIIDMTGDNETKFKWFRWTKEVEEVRVEDAVKITEETPIRKRKMAHPSSSDLYQKTPCKKHPEVKHIRKKLKEDVEKAIKDRDKEKEALITHLRTQYPAKTTFEKMLESLEGDGINEYSLFKEERDPRLHVEEELRAILQEVEESKAELQQASQADLKVELEHFLATFIREEKMEVSMQTLNQKDVICVQDLMLLGLNERSKLLRCHISVAAWYASPTHTMWPTDKTPSQIKLGDQVWIRSPIKRLNNKIAVVTGIYDHPVVGVGFKIEPLSAGETSKKPECEIVEEKLIGLALARLRKL